MTALGQAVPASPGKATKASKVANGAGKLWEQLMAGRPRRERTLIAWGGSVGLVIVLIFAIWMPLQEARTRLVRVVALERKNVTAMEAIRRELKAEPKSVATAAELPSRGGALRAAVEASARQQLNPASLEVRLDGESSLTVKLANVRMSRLLIWVDSTVKFQRLRLDAATLRSENSVLTGELRFLVPEP